jgi:hypothetical protein
MRSVNSKLIHTTVNNTKVKLETSLKIGFPTVTIEKPSSGECLVRIQILCKENKYSAEIKDKSIKNGKQ